MTKMEQLAELGQSIWLDYIQRSFITSGELQTLVDRGLRGMTSNPTIFEKAIAGSPDYATDLERLAKGGASIDDIYTALVIDDIRQAADLLRPVYDRTGGADGFVSLEVDPTLANDTQATIAEARRLWGKVDRPNLMIKIPATREGIPAITESIAAGINVNVTLIFSLERYGEVMAAYIKGLEIRREQGQPVDHIASVASFFVSRVDTKVDALLEKIIKQENDETSRLASQLRGKAAVANATMAYEQFEEVFLQGETFSVLRQAGARVQRPLWASTSTKNPDYSDIKYVEELIAPHTVNTLPQNTLEAFEDHGEVHRALRNEDISKAQFVLQSLADLGISMEQVTRELEVEGVASFAKSFESLVETLTKRRKEFQPKGQSLPRRSVSYKGTPDIRRILVEMENKDILSRIWKKDHTVWKPKPDEISNRLGWLDAWENVDREEIRAFVEQVQHDGYTQAVLLGMGGSSLAPELFARVFEGGRLPLTIVDTTDPGYVLEIARGLEPGKTLFIVSTKSGGTEETLSLFRYFYNWAAAADGEDKQPGKAFAAITDPGSKLVDLAQRYGFRKVFLNDPNIGGRYSALSYFGLVPAALSGVDIERLSEQAGAMAKACGPKVPVSDNPAARLGATLAAGYAEGKDKITFILSPEITSFGDWVEQLIAESTGKQGEGFLPVVGEPLSPPTVYGDDRLFVQIHLPGDENHTQALGDLEDSGFPLIRIPINDPYELGGQFFLWELATAIASYRLRINPFDQPDVESAKVSARQMVKAYKETGSLPVEPPDLSQDGIAVYGSVSGQGIHITSPESPQEALAAFLSQADPGDYIAIQAFITPTEETTRALNELRARLLESYQLATTVGYGPRFLHSTGQLHKGDSGNGLFIQFTSEDEPLRADIPDEAGGASSSIGFGVLKLAQAMGDRQALLEAGRRVIRFHFLTGAAEAIRRLADAVAA